MASRVENNGANEESNSRLEKVANTVNNALLAPFILASNAGLAAAHTATGGAGFLTNLAARAAGLSGLPGSDAVEKVTKTAGDKMLEKAREGVKKAADRARDAFKTNSDHSANKVLAETLLDDAIEAAVVPLSAARSAASKADEYEGFSNAVETAIRMLSSALDPISAEGVMSDYDIGREIDATFRKSMAKAALGGPFGAVARDFDGMVGGLAAFFLGDPSRLAKGARYFKESMEYVYEKKLHGEVQPKSDFPLKVQLVDNATHVVERFPERWVQALDKGDYWEIAKTYVQHATDVNTLILRYPRATYHVITGVSVFVFVQGYTQVGDAYNYALCELAIFESGLTAEEKEFAHEQLRGTAPKSIVGYEYYIPLLVPFDGDVRDKSYRRDAAGELINDHTTCPSVFPKRSIHLAQAMHSELTCLRSFLWLYGDVELAQEKNYEMTKHKFGPTAAGRIRDEPEFPLKNKEIEALAPSGPRTKQEVDEILLGLLRERGLLALADGIERGAFIPGEELAKEKN